MNYWRCGMNTLGHEEMPEVQARYVRFDDGIEVEHVLSLQPLPHKQESREADMTLATA